VYPTQVRSRDADISSDISRDTKQKKTTTPRQSAVSGYLARASLLADFAAARLQREPIERPIVSPHDDDDDDDATGKYSVRRALEKNSSFNV
jgi:hypothetical protein